MADNEENANEDVVFSPTGERPDRSPRHLKFKGGLGQLEDLNGKLNKALGELKAGQFEHLKGHEAVQNLQAKLVRLQDHFEVGAVQNLQAKLVLVCRIISR